MRFLYRGLRVLVVALGLLTVTLFVFQDALVWHPAPYAAGRPESFPRPLVPLGFRTAQGRQTAFYAPPRDGRAVPSALWVLFAGNGSRALDWEELAAADRDVGRAFLFVDYPGYGRCEGRPSPTGARENADGAFDALARRLGWSDGPALERTWTGEGRLLSVAGHSIGAGAALEFAVRHPAVGRVVLVAPFTSLRDMARRVVGWPLCWLLRGNFDNRAQLAALAARSSSSSPPPVLIFHGDRDDYIPSAMGRALAAAHPTFVRFESLPEAGHDDVLGRTVSRLLTAVDAP